MHVPAAHHGISILTELYIHCILLRVMELEWNLIKNQRNIEKHGIDFTDAVRIFEHPTLEVVDNRRDGHGRRRHFVCCLHRSGRHSAYHIGEEGKSP